MIAVLSAVVSLLSFRLRGRASLELELVTLRHQVAVLRRQHPGRPRLFRADRLLWVWLYRIWPQALHIMVLVKPATVIQWHRKGFRLYLGHDRRRIIHFDVTQNPTQVWLARQITEAFPWDTAPRFLL
jgi:hypothetical protein